MIKIYNMIDVVIHIEVVSDADQQYINFIKSPTPFLSFTHFFFVTN